MSNSTEPVSNIWHDRSELPDSNKTVLIIEKASYIGNPRTPHLSKYDTRNKCYIAVEETDIDNHPQIYNISHIEKWAYVDYLLGLSNSVAKTSEQKEPKFKIGQTITGPEDKTFTFHINRIEDGKYIESDDIWVLIKDADEEYQLVEEPVSKVWHDMIEEAENGRNIIIIDQKDFYGAVLRKGGTQLKNHNKERYVKWAYIDDIINVTNKEEPVSEDLEQAIDTYLSTYFGGEKEKQDWPFLKKMAIYFANWQKANLWKPADGDDLPEINREVIALLDNGMVMFAHRPPEYWDGKNIVTGKVTRYYPKTYGKGGWNIPDVKWWLDCLLPNMEE